ncbi:hypothetical protein Plano_1186 [Planococcus sp. PAMC 21323]|uniref:PilW family protein n=1 Tax=Planococcus sp. PAMC 21323 TaxID=1526927 RepID=UPI0005705CEC|nr:prepilin-type N-terminal cleavage/methylation domain-containing protein [Planococcus sp. PAMC 21323]AIY05151.1 hypothetical protein Plano_1186 [Planococcus sp. PAMC 21323]
MRNNEKGITMIELLAALVLVSIVVAGAWTAMTIGFKHSVVETTKTHIQQDANLIVSKLSANHRQSESYKLKFENGQLMLKTCTTETTCSTYQRVIDQNYDYNGTSINGKSYTGSTFSEVTIYPKKQHNPVKLKLTSGKTSISIDTVLTRIITGMYKKEVGNEAS